MNKGALPESDADVSTMRREAASRWLQDTITPVSDAVLALAKSADKVAVFKLIFELMARRDVSEACRGALLIRIFVFLVFSSLLLLLLMLEFITVMLWFDIVISQCVCGMCSCKAQWELAAHYSAEPGCVQ